jgi:hypothetical protein
LNMGVMVKDTIVDTIAAASVMMRSGILLFHR